MKTTLPKALSFTTFLLLTAVVPGVASAQLGQPEPDDGSIAPSPVEPVPTETQRDRAELLLSGYHGLPQKEEFEAALSNPLQTLFEIARDGNISAILRDRALGALAYWPTIEVRDHYVAILDSDSSPEMVRHRVLGHLATGFGDDAVAVIAPYLNHADLQFRLTAVGALNRIHSEQALAAIRQAQTLEANIVVLGEMQKALAP